MHTPLPLPNCPAGHSDSNAPTQAYPPGQYPLQLAAPGETLNWPTGHGPVQTAVLRPGVAPYRPTAQFVQSVTV